jgi:hypothetical protein
VGPHNKTRLYLMMFVLLAARLFVFASNAMAQDSTSSHSTPVASAPDAPTAALRDALSAACSQSQEQFSKFLTARNAQTFARLTPTARVALMKRFVLLNEPGKASVLTSPSGRPTVRCETPAGAAEMQIGGAEIDDNFALLPVEEREATDAVGNDAIRIKMGLIRENSAWKLISVGLVLLDLPALAFEWDAQEIEATERGAVDALKKIAEGIEAYRRTYARLPDSLANLGPPPRGSSASAESAGLLEPDLAAGLKNGYKFRLVIAGGSALGAPAKYALAATPEVYGRTGRRSFFRDSGGTIRGADHQGSVGSELDPKIE